MRKQLIIFIKKIYHFLKKIFHICYVKTKLYEKKSQKAFYESPKYKRLDISEKTEKRICYWENNPIKQFQKMLTMINIRLDKNIRFQHWIDTGLYFSKRYPLNGECPPDYSLIINHSIDELLLSFSNCNNSVCKNNYEILCAVKSYICRIISEIDIEIEKDSSEYLLKTKSYFERMIDSKSTLLEEALQRIIFWSSIFWQMGHSLIGLGRLDKLLGKLDRPYSKAETKSIIIDFYKTMHQYYGFKSNDLLGDTGQLIVLGGKELDGNYYCNYLTYLFIECLKDFGSPDPKILLRVSNNMPEDLLEIAVDCISTGNGSPLLSNDEAVIPSLIDFGYTKEDAYNYVTSACWEPFAYGKSIGNHNLAHVNVAKCFTDIVSDNNFEHIKSFDELESLFKKNIKKSIKPIIKTLDNLRWEKNPLMSLFTQGCLENNKDISEGGATHSDYGFLMVGLANAMDSLFNIKRFVFDQNKYSLATVKECLNCNFSGYEDMRNTLYNESYYGHDNEEYINFVNDITTIISNEIKEKKNPLGGKYCFGLSSFGYMNYGKSIPAMADGRLSFEPLSVHISCKQGLAYTELVNFACKLDYRNFKHNGNLLDYVISPDFIRNNKDKFLLFLRLSIKNGFFQMQMNVVSSEILIKAKKDPKLFPNLIVRVWGFSAYFNDLPEEYKDLLIKRTLESERT